MRPTTDEKPGHDDRRAVERQATTQLTTLTSLLAGFGFLWFTSLVDKELLTPFSLVVLVVTALTIFVLVLASIIGALLTIASEIAIREGPLHRAEALWVVATKGGIRQHWCLRDQSAKFGSILRTARAARGISQ
jgi:hypothetical protein